MLATQIDRFAVYALPVSDWLPLETTPPLESWNRKGDPAQERIERFQDCLIPLLEPKLASLQGQELTIALTVGLQNGTPLTTGGRDLDNYVFPLVQRRLGPGRFRSVQASKGYGGSWVALCAAKRGPYPPAATWRFASARVTGSYQRRQWQEDLAKQIGGQADRAPSGPLELQMAFRVGPGRNWAALWKPAIDSLGCILGEDPRGRGFHPQDDRIVRLGLHQIEDQSLGCGDVEIGVWWRLAT
jgi:hypothetical protein